MTKTEAFKWVVNYSEISTIEEVICHSAEHNHFSQFLNPFMFKSYNFQGFFSMACCSGISNSPLIKCQTKKVEKNVRKVDSCFLFFRPLINSFVKPVKKPWIEQNCHFFLFSGRRGYYFGDQHKFPCLECQEQVQMQVILDVKSMLCRPNCAVKFQRLPHQVTSFS